MTWIALAVAVLSLLLSFTVLTLLSRLGQEAAAAVKIARKRLEDTSQNLADHLLADAERWTVAGQEQENNVALLVSLSQRLRPLEGRARNLEARRKQADTPPGFVPPEERVNDYWSVINGKRVRTRGD